MIATGVLDEGLGALLLFTEVYDESLLFVLETAPKYGETNPGLSTCTEFLDSSPDINWG